MNPTVLLCLGLAGLGAALMAGATARSRRLAPDIGEFLEGVAPDGYEQRVAAPFLPRVARSVGRALGRRLERLLPGPYLANVERQLAQAGLAGRRRPGDQLAAQVALAAALGAVAVLLLPTVTGAGLRLAVLASPVIGFMVPAARLKRAIRARSDAIFKDLPDMTDMLAIAVEAGSGFEAALSLVCRHFDSPLAEELSIALREMELGMTRHDALQELRRRTDLDVVRTFALALLQADALGIPVGRILKTQAAEVRARRRSWAREKAAKLPVKILFPLMLFIFPPILVVVLAPAALSFGQL